MPRPTSSPPPRDLAGRFTAKVGPLPVWVWAALILVTGYLLYRLTAGRTGTSTGAEPAGSAVDPNSTPVTGDDGAPPASSGQGGAADNLNDGLLSQLSGFQSSIDSLTAAVQSSPAFWPGAGDAGSGAEVPNTGAPPPAPSTTTAPPASRLPAKPTARAAAPGKVRYYTFAPGKAPKTRKGDEAPARGPAGTTLRFARGKGYYYA